MSHFFIDTLRHIGLNVPPTKDDPDFFRVLGLALGGYHTQPIPDNFTDQMRVYKVSSIVYRCAQLWAESVLQAPVRIFRRKNGRFTEEITSGPVTDVLREINGHISFAEWVYKFMLDLALTGNSYTWKVRDRRGNVVELWPFRPDEVQISFDPFFDPKGNLRYEWRPFAGGIGGYGGLYAFRKHNILHMKLPSPVSQVFGTGPLRASAEDVLADQRAKKSTLSWLENEGVPAGVLQTEQPLDEDEAELIKQRWRDAHSGPHRQGRIAVLGSGTSFTPITVMPKDIEWLNQRKFSRAGILAAFGVPPIYAGLEGENFANRKEQRLLFWQDTIRPKLRLLEGQLTEFLLRDFDPELVWRFDESVVDVFVEALAGRVAAANRAADPQKRVMRPFEARERLLGMTERFEGDDEFLVQSNVVPSEAIISGEFQPAAPVGRAPVETLEGEIVEPPEGDAKGMRKLERFSAKERKISANFARDLGKYFRSLSELFDTRLTSGRELTDTTDEQSAERVVPSRVEIEDALLALSQPHLRSAFQEGFSEGEDDIDEAVEGFDEEAPL